MDALNTASLALLISVFTAVVLPLLKYLYDWRKGGREDELSGRKQVVEENLQFTGKWRELYLEEATRNDKLEVRLAQVEKRVSDCDDMNRKNIKLERRVTQLEMELSNLMAAFGYLTEKALPAMPEEVKIAQGIAAGTLPIPTGKGG